MLVRTGKCILFNGGSRREFLSVNSSVNFLFAIYCHKNYTYAQVVRICIHRGKGLKDTYTVFFFLLRGSNDILQSFGRSRPQLSSTICHFAISRKIIDLRSNHITYDDSCERLCSEFTSVRDNSLILHRF